MSKTARPRKGRAFGGMSNTWTFEGYWWAVLGANRTAAEVVRDFGLTLAGLDEWLGAAEAEAWAIGAERGPMPAEWAGFHDRALVSLAAVVE